MSDEEPHLEATYVLALRRGAEFSPDWWVWLKTFPGVSDVQGPRGRGKRRVRFLASEPVADEIRNKNSEYLVERIHTATPD